METTVEELIDFLTKFQPDTKVTYCLHSNVVDLELKQIEFFKAEDKKLAEHPNLDKGWYITNYRPGYLPEDSECVTAVVFPGN